nr:MAG TPA: hypothetical protein [Caudoviricetes sp.]
MNDIYANIVITDIKTGEIIPKNRTGWNLVAYAYAIGYNWMSNRFNEQIDSWNSEFDKNHLDLDKYIDNEEYDRLITELWNKIIDQYNEAMAIYGGTAKFEIEDLNVVMLDGFGHKVEMKLEIK